MSKQERRRVRVAASLGLTVLMSSAILGGVAPLTANAAEVGSEPTTTEVSPMITAPENPSDAVSSLPASEGSAATDETPVIEPDQTEEGAISTSEQAPAAEDPREEGPSKKDQEPRDEVSSANPVITEKVLPDEVLGAQWGDVDWTFENGVLTLSGGTGVDTREVSPWREIASEVTKVEVLDQITAPADISSLFYGFTSVTEFVGLEKIDTSNVTSMLETFALTRSLTTIDLTSWNVSRLNDVEDLFKESGIVSLDLSNWQTDVFEYTDNMFASMPALEYLDISRLVFAEGADLFGSYAPSLRTLALGSETLLANVPTEANHLWRGENTGHTFVQSYSGGSADVYRLESDATEGLWGSVTWRVENDVLYLSGGEGVSTEGASPWEELESVIHSIVIEGEIIAPEDISALFANFNDVSSYEGLEKLDVSETTNMSHMFENNFSLWVLNVDNWDTSKVTNMSYMFSDNYSGALHDLSAWDTSKVTDMSHMFENNYGVQTRDLSHWDISSVTDMSHMFGNNYSVTAYDLSGWDTHSVTNMSYMFENNYSVNGHNTVITWMIGTQAV